MLANALDLSRDKAIFLPLAGMGALTLGVVGLLAFRRVGGMIFKRKDINPQHYKLYDKGEPVDIALIDHNLTNLTETPIVFYAVAISLYLLEKDKSTSAALAWAYFGCRVAHSIVHISSNNVNARFLTFAASMAVLVSMTARLAMVALE